MQGLSPEYGYNQATNWSPDYQQSDHHANIPSIPHRSPLQELHGQARPIEKRFSSVGPVQKENRPELYPTSAAASGALKVGMWQSNSQRPALSGGSRQRLQPVKADRSSTATCKEMPAWLKEKLEQLGNIPVLEPESVAPTSFSSGLSGELTGLSVGSQAAHEGAPRSSEPQQSGSSTSTPQATLDQPMPGQQTSRGGNHKIYGGQMLHSCGQQGSHHQPVSSFEVAQAAGQPQWEAEAFGTQRPSRGNQINPPQQDCGTRSGGDGGGFQPQLLDRSFSAYPSGASQHTEQVWGHQHEHGAVHRQYSLPGDAMSGGREATQGETSCAHEQPQSQQILPESSQVQTDQGLKHSDQEHFSGHISLQPGYSFSLSNIKLYVILIRQQSIVSTSLSNESQKHVVLQPLSHKGGIMQ